MSEAIEAEVVEEGTDIVPAAPANLFHSNDPAEVLARAQSTADALMPVVRARGLVANIQGREHLRVEAWTTLGAMLGVTPVCVWTKKLDDGWEARVEARTIDGRVIGAAEAECLRAESTWKNRDDYALRSMAQTRATSKALASVLRFVATLAGFEGTPAEEMPRGGGTSAPSTPQLDLIARLLKDKGLDGPEAATVRGWAAENLTGGRDGTASKAIESLKDGTERRTAEEVAVLMLNRATATTTDIPADTKGLEDGKPIDEIEF